MEFLIEFWNGIVNDFTIAFIDDKRYLLYLEGIGNTIMLTLFATLVGVSIGVAVAITRVHHAQTGKLKTLELFLKFYITIIRGTPVLVQLLIIYYVVLVMVESSMVVAIIAFGLNSGAYVSEIIRAGIMSIDKGQTEAGRSLGLSRAATMRLIILPQAIKNILPALCNEFIAILKETSVVGLIPLIDVTKAGDLVRSRTAQAFFPLFGTALVYLILVLGISALTSRLERRFAKSDRG